MSRDINFVFLRLQDAKSVARVMISAEAANCAQTL
jgi:hypothetical protein